MKVWKYASDNLKPLFFVLFWFITVAIHPIHTIAITIIINSRFDLDLCLLWFNPIQISVSSIHQLYLASRVCFVHCGAADAHRIYVHRLQAPTIKSSGQTRGQARGGLNYKRVLKFWSGGLKRIGGLKRKRGLVFGTWLYALIGKILTIHFITLKCKKPFESGQNWSEEMKNNSEWQQEKVVSNYFSLSCFYFFLPFEVTFATLQKWTISFLSSSYFDREACLIVHITRIALFNECEDLWSMNLFSIFSHHACRYWRFGAILIGIIIIMNTCVVQSSSESLHSCMMAIEIKMQTNKSDKYIYICMVVRCQVLSENVSRYMISVVCSGLSWLQCMYAEKKAVALICIMISMIFIN